jgi:predicted transcriptional regulator
MKINNRRSNIQIIADMLRLGEAGKTEMMYSANMSYFQLQKYLKYLLHLKLIDEVRLGNPSVSYKVTEKGFTLLRNIDSIQEILEPEEEENQDSSVSAVAYSNVMQKEKRLG